MNAKVLRKKLALRTGPALGYNVHARAKRGDTGEALAANPAGDMLFIKFGALEGWAMAELVQVDGDIAKLPVWKNPMKEHTYKERAEPVDSRIFGVITSASDFKNGPSYAYETMKSIAEGEKVVLQAQSADTHWVYVSADSLGGWLPRSKVETDSDLTKLRTMNETAEGALYFPRGTVIPARIPRRVRPSYKGKRTGTIAQGTEVQVIARSKNAGWLYITAEDGGGWVPTKRLNLLGAADVAKVSVWQHAAAA